jgi:hypothetical protein
MNPQMRFTATTKEAVRILRISEATLRRLRRVGVLHPGVHYCGIGAGTVAPTLLWAPEAVQEALAERSSKIMA